MKISVVVPTLNESKYIDVCIDSLAEQTFEDFEVINVDISDDDTPDKCEQAGWKVLRPSLRGVAVQRKIGFEAATGEIIASTDADTRLDSEWLAQIAREFDRDSDVVAVYGTVGFYDGNFFYRHLAGAFYTLFLLWNRLLKKDHLAGFNFAVRKSAYEAIGGFRPELTTAEDVDLGLRIKSEGKLIFSRKVKVSTSARRLASEGGLKFLWHHMRNYLNMYVAGKSSDDFDPVR